MVIGMEEHSYIKSAPSVINPQCNFMNFSNNKKCFLYTGPRPHRELRLGEWEYPSCDFLNFRINFVCKKCRVKRPKENKLYWLFFRAHDKQGLFLEHFLTSALQ